MPLQTKVPLCTVLDLVYRFGEGHIGLACLGEKLEELGRAQGPKGPTVRVRIAVGVTAGGEWAADGAYVHPQCSSRDSEEAVATELDGDPHRLTWVEADVPLPTVDPVVTVEGEAADE